MNPINRIGQKVSCIVSFREWRMNVCAELEPMDVPQEGQVYTVSAFANTTAKAPGIHLLELPGYDCACYNAKNSAWDLRGFKPFDTRKTDISELKKLERPVNLEEKLDVRLPTGVK